jgi:hypothetical protein
MQVWTCYIISMPSGRLVANRNRNQCITSTLGWRKLNVNTSLNRSDRWAASVRLVTTGETWQNLRTSIEGPYTNQAGIARRSDQSKPGNPKSTKQTYRAPKQTKHETTATRDNREPTKTFTRAKLNKESVPVRPVRGTSRTGVTWALGLNSTRGSTPPNPTPDLPNRSTDLHKNLGIVGTPHGHSISKIWSTKTC